jgi:hypothetical protein
MLTARMASRQAPAGDGAAKVAPTKPEGRGANIANMGVAAGGARVRMQFRLQGLSQAQSLTHCLLKASSVRCRERLARTERSGGLLQHRCRVSAARTGSRPLGVASQRWPAAPGAAATFSLALCAERSTPRSAPPAPLGPVRSQ